MSPDMTFESIRQDMGKYITMLKEGRVHGSLLVENLRRERIRFRDAPATVKLLLSLEGKRPPFSNEEWASLFRNNISVALAFGSAIKNTVGAPDKKPERARIRKSTEEQLRKTFSLIQAALDKGKFPWDRFYVLLRGMRQTDEDPRVAVSAFGRLYDEEKRHRLAKDAAIGVYYSHASIASALRRAALKTIPDGGIQAKGILDGSAGDKMGRLRALVEAARDNGRFSDDEYRKKALDSWIEAEDAEEVADILEIIGKEDDSLPDYFIYLSGLYHDLAENITLVAVNALREEYRR